MKSILRKAARRLLVRVLGGGAIPRLIHNKFMPDRFTILTYHGVITEPLPVEHSCFITRADFTKQIRYLKRNFQLLSLDTALALAQTKAIDRPTVVLTFDDGFQNNFDVAFPILSEHSVPATIFLTTGFVGTDSTLWYCRLHDAIQKTDCSSFSWEGLNIDLSAAGPRAEASRILAKRLKVQSQPRLLAELERLLEALGADPTETFPKESPFRVLNLEAIKTMHGSGLVSFGGHTDSHVILSRVDGILKEEEIERSLEKVREWTGHDCKLFAFPNGQPEDYDRKTISILRANGVTAAVTTIRGGNTARTPHLELRRYGVGPSKDFDTFRLMVHHLLP